MSTTGTARSRFTRRDLVMLILMLVGLAGAATYLQLRGVVSGAELGAACSENADCHGSTRQVRCLHAAGNNYCTRRCETNADCGALKCGVGSWVDDQGRVSSSEHICVRP